MNRYDKNRVSLKNNNFFELLQFKKVENFLNVWTTVKHLAILASHNTTGSIEDLNPKLTF